MKHRVEAPPSSLLMIELKAGESLYAEPAMVKEKSAGLRMRRKIKGRFFRGIKRKILTGESFFLGEYRAGPSGAVLRLGGREGRIVPVELHGQAILCRRRAFVCFYGSLDLDAVLAFTQGRRKFDAAIFALQKISGSGTAFIYSDAYVVEEPSRAEKLLRHSSEVFSILGEPARCAPTRLR